ncbi:porin [Herbaspirillum sp. RV1423]|uniref:porin n=1 Tax=Herbaspirillum sp. RV1423 TaxID=1443993 RepID=UPI0004BB09D4|nr:porin [Herbaspirillum sp. RV1423]
MKKISLALTLLSCAVVPAVPVFAQSSVTLYGLISTGMFYTDNQKGLSNYGLLNGPQQPPRIGLIGQEDLGGGRKAFFTLENGFSITTGALGQGGRLFGRQAFIGLSDEQMGSLSFGRQIDSMAQSLAPFESAVQFATYAPPIGDADNVFATFRVSNSVQYKTRNFDGLQIMTDYGFSEAAGSVNNNSSFSIGSSYANGPFRFGAAYHVLHSPASASNTNGALGNFDYGFTSPFVTSGGGAAVDKQQMYGAGGYYKFGDNQLSLLLTNVKFDYLDNSNLKLTNYQFTGTRFLTPQLMAGASYIFTDGKASLAQTKPKWHQINLGLDYFLTKRTDLFLVGIYQRAAGDAQFAQIYYMSPSSRREQTSISFGMRHKF